MNNCTWWPEGWWSACCAAHDVNYGGMVPRIVADETLVNCVISTAPETGLFAIVTGFVGVLMYFGTRLGGWGFYTRQPKR